MGKYLTVGQVSKLLDCSPYHVVSLIDSGKLISHRLDGRGWHRITRDSVRKLVQEHGLDADWSAIEKPLKRPL